MKQKYLWISFVIFIIICFIAQIVGGIWTRETVSTWYQTLAKLSWTPPDWVFGLVWSCLYIMIAFSGWLIYRAETSLNWTLYICKRGFLDHVVAHTRRD